MDGEYHSIIYLSSFAIVINNFVFILFDTLQVLIFLNFAFMNVIISVIFNIAPYRESILSWLQSIDENKQEKKLLLEWIFQVTGIQYSIL